ncbi:alpha-L-fucosidase 2 [Edaphobacter aggregans]|uniref:Alpha-L-fucosidase 2 n=1 Tax=Edaphobacter aggregans TaxID=570835 RepID=A0A428MFM5_9BACT|nr:glycoside hydrolase family 95 protein [Edaphobacter aggregans]RSL15664.1 alpha-L-fucosidase 2 [Edaphobacter aggregans]
MTTRTTRRRFLTTSTAAAAALSKRAAFAASLPSTPQDNDTPYKLFFNQPATQWSDSLPVGNGRLGACVFGNPSRERIQLNEDSIWDGEHRDRNNPKAVEAVPKIRELLFAGKVAEAEALALSDMMSIPRRMPCYQTLGDLHLDFGPIDTPENYRLELNLDTAIATTTFTHNGTRYTREVFSSFPDQVIVIRLTSSTPGKLNLIATLDRPAHFATAAIASNRLTLSGEALPVNDNPGLPIKERQVGIRYYAELLALTDLTGAVTTKDATLTISNATTATLFIDCTTSYRYPTGEQAMQSAVAKNLTAARVRTYADLRSRHIADHQRLFRRAEISFLAPGEKDPNSATPTDKRVQCIKNGGEDIHLLPIYFQYGRYMLISSSRPGTLASNLQGIWNESVDPPWGSKYTININTEMNYWLANRANLADLNDPLFDLIENTRPSGTITAQRYYKARGTVIHHNTDIWGDTSPIDALGGGIWPMGGAWLSLHLWDHFDYTHDIAFLRDRAYPRLRDNALFLLDYLIPAPAGSPYAGHLITGPSCSPENKYKLPDGSPHNLCMGPTIDIEITRAVLTCLLQAAEVFDPSVLTSDTDLHTRARTALTKLPPFKIGKAGNLQEWPEDYVENEPGHRHISHLFALFPDDQITPRRTPEFAQACRTTLDRRLAANGGSTGWSRSWIINCMARLEDGDAAYQNVLQLFRQSTRSNLFDVCGLQKNAPFQVDGNLGGPTGLIEMLLQSHANSTNPNLNVVRFLPALPAAWPTGTFRGLCARGALEIDLAWHDGKATKAVLKATSTHTHRLAAPKGQTITSITPPGSKPVPADAADEISLPIKTGEAFIINFA